MDIGCRFYTPIEISNGIAIHAGQSNVIVDLFSGSGNLYKAFYRKGYANKAMAFDINPLVFKKNENGSNVIHKVVDCLNPEDVKNHINGHCNEATTFVLNPPFKRLSVKQELFYWKRFKGYQPSIVTQRVECIAIASALYAAAKSSVLYVILPEIVLDSRHTSHFCDVLKTEYSMKVIKKYKRAKFSSAEVDVVVIVLKKKSNGCITKMMEKKLEDIPNNSLINNASEIPENNFKLFRGMVRDTKNRRIQISVKDIEKGGVEIRGNKTERELIASNEKKYSFSGDILIARVGQRMMGRVGIIVKDCVLTNESIFSLRIPDRQKRIAIYNILKSKSFLQWCNTTARGTANYFLKSSDLHFYISRLIEK
jgi:hypothetical protein